MACTTVVMIYVTVCTLEYGIQSYALYHFSWTTLSFVDCTHYRDNTLVLHFSTEKNRISLSRVQSTAAAAHRHSHVSRGRVYCTRAPLRATAASPRATRVDRGLAGCAHLDDSHKSASSDDQRVVHTPLATGASRCFGVPEMTPASLLLPTHDALPLALPADRACPTLHTSHKSVNHKAHQPSPCPVAHAHVQTHCTRP